MNTPISNLKHLEENIYVKLNNKYHRSLLTTPYSLMFDKSSLNDENLKNAKELRNRAIDNCNKNKIKNNDRTNKKRIKHEYKINDFVYEVNRTVVLQDKLWKGLFKIKEIRNMRILLVKQNYDQWVNV
ncbi:hypothetical protein DMUE_4454 [Dictyocoela muelleri]|nr:hypothetical protein DMUE_4454 [Dictyocoela muelleri]